MPNDLSRVAVRAIQEKTQGGLPTLTDHELAQRYGAYAGFATDADPIATDTHGDAPADEMDRLLDVFATTDAQILDLGCGAGQTLCRLAPKVNMIWGVDLEEPLLQGAQRRIAEQNIANATLILGDTTDAATVAKLPDNTFNFAFSRRGPFLTSALMTKLTPNAHFLVELAQDALGLKELFGRKPFSPRDAFAGADFAVSHHAGLGWLPVSVKDYYFEQYFRDAAHLEAFLITIPACFSNWWMERKPYDPEQDRDAFNVYVRYNTTPTGIRLTQRRKIYLFRRAQNDYYPVDGNPA